jgi:serine/threonine protein phosphatase PrpC
VLLGVADGVGSRPNSHLAAAAALDGAFGASEELGALLDPSPTMEAFEAVVSRASAEILHVCSTEEVDRSTLATTMVVAGIGGDDGNRWVRAVRVGDSDGYLVRDGQWHLLFPAEDESSVISSTNTESLPSEAPALQVAEHEVLPGDVIVLCTDGFSGTLNGAGRSAYLAEQWGSSVPSLTELLWHVDAMVRSYGDDRSVAVWWEARA